MNVGDTFREDGKTMTWARCPGCSSERAIRKKHSCESPLRLCKECHLKQAKITMESLWKRP